MKSIKTFFAILFALTPPVIVIGGILYGTWYVIQYLQTHTPIHDIVYFNPFDPKASFDPFPGYKILYEQIKRFTPFLNAKPAYSGIIRSLFSILMYLAFIKLLWWFAKRSLVSFKIILANPRRIFILIRTYVSFLWY